MDLPSVDDLAPPRRDDAQDLTGTDTAVQSVLSKIAAGQIPEPEITNNLVEAEKQYWEEHGPPPTGYSRQDMHAKFLSDTALWMDETDKQLKVMAAQGAEIEHPIRDSAKDYSGPSSEDSENDYVSCCSGQSNTPGGPFGAGDSKNPASEQGDEPNRPTTFLDARRHVLDRLFTTPPRPPSKEPQTDQRPCSPVPTEPWSRPVTPMLKRGSLPTSPTVSVFNPNISLDADTLHEKHFRLLRDYQSLIETYSSEKEKWQQKENGRQSTIEELEQSLENAENLQKSLRAFNEEMMRRLQEKNPKPNTAVSDTALAALGQQVKQYKADKQALQRQILVLQETLKSEINQKNQAVMTSTVLKQRHESLLGHMKSAKTGAYRLIRNAEIQLEKAEACQNELKTAAENAAEENDRLLCRAIEAEQLLQSKTQCRVQSPAGTGELEKLREQMVVAQKKVADLQRQNERLLRKNLESSEDCKRPVAEKTKANQKLVQALVTLRSDVKAAQTKATTMEQEKNIALGRVSKLEATLQEIEQQKQALRGKITEANMRTMDERDKYTQHEKLLRKAEESLKITHTNLQAELKEKQRLAAYAAEQKSLADSGRAKNIELNLEVTKANDALGKVKKYNGTLKKSVKEAMAGRHHAQYQQHQANRALLAEQQKAAHLAHLLAVAEQTQAAEPTQQTEPISPNIIPFLHEQTKIRNLEQHLASSQHELNEVRAHVGSLQAQLSAANSNYAAAGQSIVPALGGPPAMLAHMQDLELQKQSLFEKVETITEEKDSWERQFLERNAYVIAMENQLQEWKEWAAKGPTAHSRKPPQQHDQVNVPHRSTHRTNFGERLLCEAYSPYVEEQGINPFDNAVKDHVRQVSDRFEGESMGEGFTQGLGITWDGSTCGDMVVELSGDWIYSV